MTSPLVVGCGALVSELRAVLERAGLGDRIEVRYLPANLHNRPDQIVPAIRETLRQVDPLDERPLFIAYGDCGTGGRLAAFVAGRPNTEQLPGAHCYEFFAGACEFAGLADEEPGTFYLTDFLAKHFVPLVWQGLALDRHPELREQYFAHYRRVVWLSQEDDDDVRAAAARAADLLALPLVHRHVGLLPFADAVSVALRVGRPA